MDEMASGLAVHNASVTPERKGGITALGGAVVGTLLVVVFSGGVVVNVDVDVGGGVVVVVVVEDIKVEESVTTMLVDVEPVGATVLDVEPVVVADSPPGTSHCL